MATIAPPVTSTLSGPHGGAHRAPAVGLNGVISAAHGLASTAGLRILLEGGNAVDAAIATAAALAVVEPFMSGLGGGGGFMLIREGASGVVHALDFIGRVPAAADPTVFGDVEQVADDVRSATVPGTLGGWAAALDRFGTMDLASVLVPAIGVAERGYPISPFAAQKLAENAGRLARYSDAARVYLPGGRPPVAGEVVQVPELARTLRLLAGGGVDEFYRGELAGRLVGAVQAAGGWLTEADLAAFEARWVEPLAIDYRGHRLQCPPPPSTGFQYLECLKILEPLEPAALGHNSAEYLHLVLETIKLASADRTRWARAERPTIEALLGDRYAADRRALIDRRRAALSEGERFLPRKRGEVEPGDPARYVRDHTTHFEAADRWGNVVAVTQSNGGLFGSGFVAGDTGLPLNNFLYWTDLDPASPNVMQPGGRRESAMSPCLVTHDGELVLGIGTPGSYGILQTTLQMLLNAIDFGMNVQAAIEAPRVRAFEGTLVDAEGRIAADALDGLRAHGHEVNVVEPWTWKVGGGHAVARDPTSGVLMGGADPRRDGQAVAW